MIQIDKVSAKYYSMINTGSTFVVRIMSYPAIRSVWIMGHGHGSYPFRLKKKWHPKVKDKHYFDKNENNKKLILFT